MPGLTYPVSGPVTSPFGYRSGVNPLQGNDYHTGIDFGVPIGTPVYATHSGTFRTVQNYGGGTMVIGQGAFGYETVYAHLSRSTVGNGQYVTQGQLIGYSGRSGAAVTGPHLHYEVKRGGQHLDPRYAVPAGLMGGDLNALSRLLPGTFRYDAATAAEQQRRQLAELQRAQAEQRQFEIDRSRGILGEFAAISRSQRDASRRFGIDTVHRSTRLGPNGRRSRFQT